MKKLLIGFIIGITTSTLFAQINTNEAVYGRMFGTGVGAALAIATGTAGSFVLNNQAPVAVGSLPTCNSGNNNLKATVNNALTPALGIVVSDSGALTVGVICKNGTGWIVY